MTNPPSAEKAIALTAQGSELMQQGKLDEAIACFRQAWQEAGLVAALNNWATALYYQDKPAEALQVLDQLQDPALIHPYRHALASRCYTALGDLQRARECLQRAVRDFEAGRFRIRAFAGTEQEWIEYTTIIKEAATELGDYRLVLDLHNRWPGRELARGAFLAGVAAFNLGKYRQAIRIWERVRDPAWIGPLSGYVLVAQWTDRGVIPPFQLDSDPPDAELLRNLTPEQADKLPVEGSLRLYMLATVFAMADEEPDEEVTLVAEIIRRTGDWGMDLGRRILESASLPIGLKFGAARALVEAGVFEPGQPIPVVHQGRRTEIVVQMKQVPDGPIPELEDAVAEARRLWREGEREAAMKRVVELREGPVLYPPAVLLEADFLREQGKLDEALVLLGMLHDLMPEQPAVLFRLALIHLDMGEIETARRFADEIDASRLSPDFRRDLERLKAAIRAEIEGDHGFIEDHQAYIAAFMDAMREEQDERPIRLDVRLATALRRIPVPWLNAAAQRFAIEPQRRRPEREKVLAAAMLDADRLQAVLADEPPAVREALSFVLAEGGWVKLYRLTRRFGDQTGDGFYWEDKPPASTIGRLRALGILHVGRAQVDGRNHKVAVVPVELRPLLQ